MAGRVEILPFFPDELVRDLCSKKSFFLDNGLNDPFPIWPSQAGTAIRLGILKIFR